MKTIILTLFLAATSFAQIEQVASSSENSRGIPIAYFIDKDSIVQNKNEVTFTGIATGIKGWKENFEIDTSEYFIISEIWANCSTRSFKILKQSGIDGTIHNFTFNKPSEKQATKGTIIGITLEKICPKETKLKA